MERIDQTVMQLGAQLTGTLETPTRKRIPPITQEWADWFKLKIVDQQVSSMIDIAANWALDIKEGEKPKWLSLLGSSGCGKTHIAKRLWHWITKRPDFQGRSDYSPQYIYWPKFVEELRSGAAYNRYQDMMRWRYLVLDDVCGERETDYSTEKLHNLLGSRDGKWTLITSNKRMMDIAILDRRIASRMVRGGSLVADIRTKDYNLRTEDEKTINPGN